MLDAHNAAPAATESLLVLDQQGVDNFGAAAFGFYAKTKGFFVPVAGAAGLAEFMHMLYHQDDSTVTLADLTATVEETLKNVESAAGGAHAL